MWLFQSRKQFELLLWLELRVLLDASDVAFVERDGVASVVIKSTLVIRDGGTNEVLMLGFKQTVEFLRCRGWIVFDVEEIGEFCSSKLGLKKGNELMSLAWIAVEGFCIEVECV